jgi:hypothetical protein
MKIGQIAPPWLPIPPRGYGGVGNAWPGPLRRCQFTPMGLNCSSNDRYVAHATDAPSRVDFDGGIGTDVANYLFASAGVRVSVDLSAGDGRPGDDDRIRRNVETVLGSAFADVLAGGPHAEHLAGFDGDDQITGGAGEDVLSGARGNDRIDARDGEPDAVDCGGWALDWAAVDIDAEASITGCAEVVS